MRGLPTLLVAAGAAALAASCRPATVELSFRPQVGAQYRYRVEVRQVTLTRLGDQPEERKVENTVIEADDTVLDSGPEGVRVRVELRRPGGPARSFVLFFERAGQLSGVERVEGLPAEVLTSLAGADQGFPAALGGPPDRPLAPGERWVVDAPVRLAGAPPTRLTGWGRLVELKVEKGRKLAAVEGLTRLPVRRSSAIRSGTVELDGVETTESTVVHALSDGSVERAVAETRGRFRLVLNAPGGSTGPVTGSLTIDVRSRTRRVR